MFVSTTRLNISTAECCNRAIHSLASLSLERSTCLHLDILIDNLVDTTESDIRQVVHLSTGDSHSSVAQAYPRSLPRAQCRIRSCLTKPFNWVASHLGTLLGERRAEYYSFPYPGTVFYLIHSASVISNQINHCKSINDMPLRAVYICKIMMNKNECGNQCNRITRGPISISSAAASPQVGHQRCQLLPYA
jgi:hypothetical protein